MYCNIAILYLFFSSGAIDMSEKNNSTVRRILEFPFLESLVSERLCDRNSLCNHQHKLYLHIQFTTNHYQLYRYATQSQGSHFPSQIWSLFTQKNNVHHS